MVIHEIDSNERTFRMAGKMAAQAALELAFGAPVEQSVVDGRQRPF
jgi:hypothetical protein